MSERSESTKTDKNSAILIFLICNVCTTKWQPIKKLQCISSEQSKTILLFHKTVGPKFDLITHGFCKMILIIWKLL